MINEYNFILLNMILMLITILKIIYNYDEHFQFKVYCKKCSKLKRILKIIFNHYAQLLVLVSRSLNAISIIFVKFEKLY